jgi:hypothetical protein
MKFPFEFNIAFVFRLVLPGFVLAVAAAPLLDAILRCAGAPFSTKEALPFAAVGLGWVVVLLDQHIYQFFEGRRYWPSGIRNLRAAMHQEALDRKQDEIAAHDRARKQSHADAHHYERWVELSLETLNYPRNKAGQPYARYPTRLGNLITAFETYPEVKYGVDGVFYWPRLWVKLDKDLRAEIDQTQALADSAIYVAFAFLAAALLCLVYWVMGWPRVGDYPAVALTILPEGISLPWLALGCAAASYIAYSLSLEPQRVYGELFKSIFDQHRALLTFLDEAGARAVAHGAAPVPNVEDKRAAAAMRFLKWHRVRDANGQNQPATAPTP